MSSKSEREISSRKGEGLGGTEGYDEGILRKTLGGRVEEGGRTRSSRRTEDSNFFVGTYKREVGV